MKRFFATLAVLFVAGIAAVACGLSAARLEPAPLAVDALPPASPPREMSLSSLPTGAMLSRAGLAFRGGSLFEKREFAMNAILVQHPRGNLLFDAGFGRDVDEHAQMLPMLMKLTTTYRKGTPAAVQLTAHGFDLSSLAGVVLTHSHWDHVSGLDSFPGVRVWVSAAEREFIAAATPHTALLRRISPATYRTYDFDSGPYLGFSRSHDVWGDGSVVLVPAPGHTPGSVIAFLALPSGKRYALVGDLAWQMEGIELPAERPWIARRQVDLDAESVRRHLALVAALHRRFPEIQFVPAHDARAAREIPEFPSVAR